MGIKMLVRSSPARDEELCWNWKGEHLELDATLRARGRTYNGYPVTRGYFGAFCMDGLAMALWAVYNTSCFDDGPAGRCAVWLQFYQPAIPRMAQRVGRLRF